LKSLIANFLIISIATGAFLTSSMAQEVKLKPAPAAVKAKKTTSHKKKKSVKTVTSDDVDNNLPAIKGTIKDIQVEGTKRLEKDVITNRIHSEVGQAVDREKIREDIQALFALGYFETVEVETKPNGDGLTLIYRIKEKPVLSELTFEGNSELKTEEVQDALGMKAFEIFNQAKLHDGIEKIQKLYEDKGFYLVKITPVITMSEDKEQANLLVKIEENEKVKVKKIHFIGNKKLSDDYLKGKLATQEEGYFSAVSSSGTFKQDAFDRDTQMLRFIYYNQGYAKAKIDRPQVSLTPDKLGIYITFRIEEGEQYAIGDVDYAGDLLFPIEKLKETSHIQNNKIFSYEVLQKDLTDLQALYGDLGYAYANVIPRTRFDDAAKRVDLVFEFDKGNKVHFGRINVVGNSKTRDKVVRRELKIKEGELYNETRRKQSLENIQRLGFFDEVNFKTSTPVGQPDIMDIDIVVKERNTGQIQIGAGYSTSNGFALQGSVQQTNFRGLGQNLGVSLQLSRDYNQYDLSFTEPYYNDTDWSLGERLFETDTSGRLDYNERKMGASVFTSHPIGEFTRAGTSYTFTHTKLYDVWDTETGTDNNTYSTLLTVPDLFPLNTADGDSGQVGVYVEYDTRNDRLRPTKGIYAKLSYADSGLLGGNLKYYRAGADYRFFRDLFWDVVWRNSLSYARIEPTESGKAVPFNELNILGGPYSLRGFRYATVGRRRHSDTLEHEFQQQPYNLSQEDAFKRADRVFGGEQQLMYQTELMYPMIREADMYGVFFYDIGQAEDQISMSKFYADWGIGIRWFSPLGPLRFEWGFPINRDPVYHDASVFEFSIGTPF
jgi:outer membrane protein insertion porin family